MKVAAVIVAGDGYPSWRRTSEAVPEDRRKAGYLVDDEGFCRSIRA